MEQRLEPDFLLEKFGAINRGACLLGIPAVATDWDPVRVSNTYSTRKQHILARALGRGSGDKKRPEWRFLFERLALGAAVTDSTLRFVVVNPAFLTMVGYSSEELQQLSLLDICVDGEGDEHRVPLRELCEGVRLQYEFETQYRRKDGASLPVNTYLSAVSGRAPNQQTFLTLAVDVTARQAAEDALRRINL